MIRKKIVGFRKLKSTPQKKAQNLGSISKDKSQNNIFKMKRRLVMRRNEIIEEINNRGFVAQVTTAIKNGIEKEGITIRKSLDDKVAPTLYVSDFSGSAAEIAEQMIDIYNQCDMDFDLSMFSDKDYILSHIRIGLQATGTEQIVKRPSQFEGLENYLYLSGNRGNEHFTVKLKKEMLVNADIAFNIAWSMAARNTYAETTIKPLFSMVADMLGADMPMFDAPQIFVVSNQSNFRGAANIADRRSIKDLADKIGVHSFYVIGSSIHETIIIPKDGTCSEDISVYESMCREVNSTVVSPEDKLTDTVYTLNIA